MPLRPFFTFALTALALAGCDVVAEKIDRHHEDYFNRVQWVAEAEKGDIEAQYIVAESFCCGEPPYKDDQKALRYYCMAGRQGQMDALFKIAQIHDHTLIGEGSSIPLNYTKAHAFYALAERYGRVDAKPYRNALTHRLDYDALKLSQTIQDSWPHSHACEVTPYREPTSKNVKAFRRIKKGLREADEAMQENVKQLQEVDVPGVGEDYPPSEDGLGR